MTATSGTATKSTLTPASLDDAAEVAAVLTAAAAALTARHGPGHWSTATSEKGVRWAMRRGRVYVARRRNRVVATLCLTTRKPWAIDRAYFTAVPRPLYLIAMAVVPVLQGAGLGRRCLADVPRLVRDWPADAVRLDAYEGPAGAGGFYAACGYAARGRTVYRGVPLEYYEWLVPVAARPTLTAAVPPADAPRTPARAAPRSRARASRGR